MAALARPMNDLARLLLLATAAILVSTQGNVPCPSRCRSCIDDMVDCSAESLTAPPNRFPTGTKVINLENNHIRVLGHRSFIRSESVEELRVGQNRIGVLSNDAFGRPFPNLLTLDLTRNRISRIYRRALRGMGHLRTLNLNQNRISSLSRIFHGTPNLYQLNLARNRISRIGQNDLAPLTTVHHVDLRSNRITRIHAKAFKELTRLRYLFLNNNPLISLSGMQWGSQVLRSLDVSSCQLTSIPNPLPRTLSDLRLGKNNIRQVNYTDFDGVEDVQMLELNENGLSFLADGALRNLGMLREVFLRNNELVYVPRDLPARLLRLHMESNHLTRIDTDIFPEDSELTYLSVQNNAISSILPHTFRNMRHLGTLNLQDNQLQAIERDAFTEVGSLVQLLLSQNPLQRIDSGAFGSMPNLTLLQMAQLSSETFELGQDFLQGMPGLRSFNLMGSTGLAQALMDSLESSNSGSRTPLRQLLTLDVSYNNLRYVPPQVRTVFPGLDSFFLDSNPLTCSTRLRWLRDWMISGSGVNFYRTEEPVCASPFTLSGRTLTSITDNEWVSENELASSAQSRSSAWGGYAASDQPQEIRKRGGMLRSLGPTYGRDGARTGGQKTMRSYPAYGRRRSYGRTAATRVLVKYPDEKPAEEKKKGVESRTEAKPVTKVTVVDKKGVADGEKDLGKVAKPPTAVKGRDGGEKKLLKKTDKKGRKGGKKGKGKKKGKRGDKKGKKKKKGKKGKRGKGKWKGMSREERRERRRRMRLAKRKNMAKSASTRKAAAESKPSS